MQVDILKDVCVSPNGRARDPGAACAYAQTARTPDGDIVCAYRHGTTKHSYDGVCVAQISSDMGRTWSDAAVVFDMTADTQPRSVLALQLLTAPDGSLLALLTAIDAARTDRYVFSEDGFALNRAQFRTRSRDGGRSWEPPELIEHFNKPRMGLPGKSFALANGEILASGAYTAPPKGRVVTASFSQDSGQSFGPLKDMAWDPETRLCFDDPHYTVFPDGLAVGMFWTYTADTEATVEVHRSESGDHGRTWSKPAPVGALGQLTAPLALDDDLLLLAANFRQAPAGVRLWLSHDRGRSFRSEMPVQMWDAGSERLVGKLVQPEATVIRNEGVWDALATFTFGAPDLLDLRDGTVLLTYYVTVDNVIHVRACRFRVT